MGTYNGKLRLALQEGSPLNVEIVLDEERIRITSNGSLIGDWSMSEVQTRRVGNSVHLFAEDEQMIISSAGSEVVSSLLNPSPGGHEEMAEGERMTDEPKGRGPRFRRGAHRAPSRMRWKW